MPSPLFRACVSHPTYNMLRAIFVCLALCLIASSAHAQNPAIYPGTSQSIPGTYTDNSCIAVKSWAIDGPNNLFVSGPTPVGGVDHTGGWQVTYKSSFSITPPASTALGTYYVNYGLTQTGSAKNDTLMVSGPGANFNVVSPAPRPAAGNPAFSWQGSVAGVNTGNGNKTTVVPITGWTMRGGMGVSCALYHNSQGANYVTWGNKWTPSYFSFISGGQSAPILHWDNGLVEAFPLVSTISGVTTYASPYGILDKLTYAGGIFTLTTTSNTVYTFGYVNGNAYLSSITDMDGNTLSIGHNSDTTISAVTDATGRKLTYAYSGGRLVSVTDPLSRTWYFNYGTAGGTSSNNLWYVTQPVLNGQNYADWFGYDANSNITAMQSPQGHAINATSTFGYDTSSPPRLIWAKDPLGNQTTFTYNATNTVITDPNGHTTTHTYQYGRLISVTDALNYTGSTAYDYNNIVTSTKDKRGNFWYSSSHFSNGTSSSSSTDPLNFTSTTVYDAKNKVTRSVDPIGNVSASTYTTDAKEDLLTSSVTGTGTAPFKATSTVGGYSYGLPTTFTDPLGYGSSVGYDANGYVNSATDANSHTSTAVSNALGWKTSSTDANSHTTSYTYDGWGRVTAVTAPDSTQTTTAYDLDGNVLTVTDANSHTVTNVYDGDDRLIQTTNGRGDVVRYTYDGTDSVSGAPQRGLLSSKTDGNSHTTYYSYTARNEPAATYYPDSTSESVTYDPNGNTLTRTKADGKVIQYAYDADNRLTDITYPTLHATHFGYDADGRKTLMTDATGTTTWSYNYDGIHLTQLANPQETLTYVPDGEGRLSYKYVNLPGVGVSSYWYNLYDPAGRLTSLRSTLDGTTTYTYDAANRLTQKTQGNGNYQTYAYDVCDEVTGIGYWNPGGNYQNGLTYTYDPAGNVTVCNQNWYTTTYGYDGADQLVSEIGGGTYAPPSYAYTYDHNGNRLTQTVNGQPYQSFVYDAHDKLTSGTGETDGHDLNGNETSITINGSLYQMRWDDEDRLIGETLPNGTVDTFTYNGLGLRVGKTDSTGTYSFACDGASPGSPVLSDGHALYTPGLSQNRAGVSSYDSNDLLGNLWFVDTTGTNQTYYQDTSAFGALLGGAGTDLSPFKFGGGNGCQTDTDIGFVLMGHRYYDSRQGRFISQDPIGDGTNWYAYTDNSPTNYIDPSGLVIQDGPGSSPMGSPGYSGIGDPGAAAYNDFETKYTITHTWIQDPKLGADDLYHYVDRPGSDTYTIAADPFWQLKNDFRTMTNWLGITHCFTKDTPIQEQGKTKPIQSIHIGENVATRNLLTGKTEYRKVVRTFKHLAHETITVTFANGKTGKIVDTLTATPEHPFYVPGQGMTALGKLGIGTLVVTRAGPPVMVHSLIRYHSAAGVMVYNIEVEGDHTYFVGNNGEWVHNTCNVAIDEAASTIKSMIKNMIGSRPMRNIVDRKSGAIVGEKSDDGGPNLIIRYPHKDRGTPVLHWNIVDEGAGINWHIRIIL